MPIIGFQDNDFANMWHLLTDSSDVSVPDNKFFLWLISNLTKKMYIFRENKSQLILKCATDGGTYNHFIRLIVYSLHFGIYFP